MNALAQKIASALILFWTLCLAWGARQRIDTLEAQLTYWQEKSFDARKLCEPERDPNYPTLQVDPIPDYLLDTYENPL